MTRICKNKITDHIRDHFGANPLKSPEARIKPMCMLEVQRDKQDYLGEFAFLIVGDMPEEIPVNEEPVAPISDERSNTVDFKIGFGILGNFLKVLGVDPAGVGAAMKKSKKMAFSFSNVRRRFIDPLQLGKVLSQHDIIGDTDNFMLHPAINDKRIKLALITDIIVSNNFSISTFTESETEAELDVPLIANAVSNFNTEVKVERKSNNEVKFNAPNDLTFAFSALELKIDPASGKFSRGDWLKNLKSATGESLTLENLEPGKKYHLDHVLIDESKEYPLLIEF